MAIAVNGGHVSRALDFYNKENKYFIIGGSTPWENEPTPDLPNVEDFKLRDVIGLKRIDNTFLVVPDNDKGTIVYRDQKWRVVSAGVTTKVIGDIPKDATSIPIESISGLVVGAKIRINNQYEGIILNITGTSLVLDKAAPANIPDGSKVEGGALIEGAKYVYVEGYLEYDKFPLITYRQIGLCTGVTPKSPDDANILKSASYSLSGTNEYDGLGVLEILDNRAPIARDIDMRELISMIIEF